MKISMHNALPSTISKHKYQLERSFEDLCTCYQIQNVAIVELRAATGKYVDDDIQSSEYYRVILKNKHGGIIHADRIDYLYVVKEGEHYCFVQRKTEYRPEQHTVH